MDESILRELLLAVSRGETSVPQALERLKALPFEDIGLACVDHHRGLRQGLSEVIFGQGKTAADILAIMQRMLAQQENILVTRLDPDKAEKIQTAFPQSTYHAKSRVLTLFQHPVTPAGKGLILVVCAGTSDIPVAEEAALTARFMGHTVETVYDLGVAGLHRLLAHRQKLAEAAVIIVAAGMEGALPSVVSGLVSKPVIAVPTSVGYGASFGGIAAL
ncbi:MAG: nickel pincer cofactor biosynthesis protein LarB, partial [Desulfobacteraceae bacterium]